AVFFALLVGSKLDSQKAYAASSNDGPVYIQILGPSTPPGFSPSLATVHVNQQVIFVNNTSSAASYTLKSADNSFNSPAISPGKQWPVTFTQPGTHQFSEAQYSQQMVGLI